MLGVVSLLVDIGLLFSVLAAPGAGTNIFGLGPLQVVLGAP